MLGLLCSALMSNTNMLSVVITYIKKSTENRVNTVDFSIDHNLRLTCKLNSYIINIFSSIDPHYRLKAIVKTNSMIDDVGRHISWAARRRIVLYRLTLCWHSRRLICSRFDPVELRQ
jgi:hypothetical protein